MKKILAIDHCADMGDLIASALEMTTSERCSFVAITDFRGALKRVEENLDADAVFVDYHDLSHEGAELARIIKTRLPKLKVYLMGDHDVRHLADQLGLDGFLQRLNAGPRFCDDVRELFTHTVPA